MSLYNLYQRALKEIQCHWEHVFREAYVCAPYEEKRNEPTILDDLEEWLEQLIEQGCPSSIFLDGEKDKGIKLYPECVLDESGRVVVELQTLLPDAPEVNAILPVLVTGYIMNRRGQTKSSQKDKRDNTTNLFLNLRNGKDYTIHSYFMQHCESLFSVNSWNETYPKVAYFQMTKARMKKSLSYFGMINLFLFLAYKLKAFCNLTLSCQLFEEFVEDPGFCDNSFPHLDIEITLHTKGDPLNEEISQYLQKLYENHTPGANDAIKDNPLANEMLNRYIVFSLMHLKNVREKNMRMKINQVINFHIICAKTNGRMKFCLPHMPCAT